MRSIVFLAAIIFLLSGCSADLQKAQERLKDSAVRSNMYTVQVAAEQYALDHKGTYPNAIDDVFKSYFAGGDCGLGRAIGRAPTNPFTNKTEWPLQGSITDIETARNAEPVEMKPGEIQYNALKDATSYAIIGGARDGKALHNDAGKIIILTNK